MTEERISEAEEQRLLGAVRRAVSSTNTGVMPDVALAKEAQAEKYGPDFINRMVEIYNTSRTLAHLKQASKADRSQDFPLADASSIIQRVYGEPASTRDIEGGVLGKAANYMAFRAYEEQDARFEKAAAYLPDGNAKFAKVVNSVRDLDQDIVNLRTKRAQIELERDQALGRAATYFRKVGHRVTVADADARMRSMFGQAGKLAMDVLCESLGTLAAARSTDAPTGPKLADLANEPYNHLNQFVEKSAALADANRRIHEKEDERLALKEALRERVKRAYIVPMGVTAGILNKALEGPKSDADKPSAAKAFDVASDPEYENTLRSIHAQSTLNELMATDPVIGKYDPEDVSEAYNEIARLTPVASTQPAVLRGALRRYLESSPDTSGRVLETHEVGQLADIEKTLGTGRDSVKDVLKAVGSKK